MSASRNNASVISRIADTMHVDLSSEKLNGQSSTVAGVVDAQRNTQAKLCEIQDMKAEMCKQLTAGVKPGAPSVSAPSSRHAIPEAESRFANDMLFDAAMAGVGFAVAGPAGVAAAGVIGAIKSAGALMTGSSQQHQGTIHFGERGVEGGELNDPVASSSGHGKQADTYVDVTGGTQQTGAGYKAPATTPQPMMAANSPFFGSPSSPQSELSAAVGDVLAQSDMKQVMAELGGKSEAEQRLTRDLGYQHRLMEEGLLGDMSAHGTLAQNDEFKAKFQGFKAPPAFKMTGSAPRMG